MFDSSGELFFEIHSYLPADKLLCSARRPAQCISKSNSPEEFSGENLKINIFIGPEGGWTEKEIEEAKNNDFKIATLGNLILRAETAAIVSTYLAVNI